MSEQVNWVPLPKPRRRTQRLKDAFTEVDRLIAVYGPTYEAFEASVGKRGITLTKEGIRYRGFLIGVHE